jgi:CRISPR-associated protein Cas5t
MEMYKIMLRSDTAFFRNDVTSTSYQESFNCPPLSTIHGLIAAACGDFQYDVDIGYLFRFSHKTTDFELILRKDSSKRDLYINYLTDSRFDRNDILRGCQGTIPIKREILFDCELTLYVSDIGIAKAFEKPFYALLLGRSEDLARVVNKPRKITLQEVITPARIGQTIIPFKESKMIPGRLSKMNVIISEDDPRVVKKTDIFNIIDKVWSNIESIPPSLKLDPEIGMSIYIHEGGKYV